MNTLFIFATLAAIVSLFSSAAIILFFWQYGKSNTKKRIKEQEKALKKENIRNAARWSARRDFKEQNN